MARRYTLLSIAVSAAVAWALITPSRPVPPVPPADARQPAQNQIRATPEKPIEMASVTLPPPPAPVVEQETAPAPAAKEAQSPAPFTALSPRPAAATAPRPVVKARRIAPLLPVKSLPPSEPLTPVSVAEPAKPVARPVAAEPRPEPQTETHERAREKAAETGLAGEPTSAQGRPLLKLLEVGEGPSIEISWPNDSASQARLYDLFRRCYGMRVALMNARGELFDTSGEAAQTLRLNTDKYSGFVRQSQGRVSPSEAEQIRTLRTHHRLPSGNAVRLFPRETDALLLAGLHQLIGPSYRANRAVQARYTISGRRIQIVDIRSDGTPVQGTVDLSAAINRNCRR